MSDDVLTVIPENDPDPADFPARARAVAERARAFQVVTAEDYKTGAEAMRRIKRQRVFLDSIHKPAIRAAAVAYDEAKKAFRTLDSMLEIAFDAIKGRCEAWLDEQRKEQMRQLEAAKVTVSAPVVAAASDKQLGDAFDAAVSSGDTAKAAHLLNQANMPPVMQMVLPTGPPTTVFVPKVAGISSSAGWTYDVVDESLVPSDFLEIDTVKIAAMPISQVPREYLCVDRKKVSKVVKAMGPLTRISGIIVRPDTGMRVRV